MSAVLRPFVMCVRYWPQLVACYLAGVLGRHWAIELAAWAGHDNDWWAALIMPLAAMAQLGSYVAMFLVLRRAIPALNELPRTSALSVDVFATIIVPFFAVYLAWQLFRDDWVAFETRALDYRIDEAVTSPTDNVELHPELLPASATTWVLIGAALACRLLLSALRNRLPKWLVVVRVYVDAVWVFLVLTFSVKQGVTLLVKPADWLSERRIIVWLNNTRADLFSSFRPLEIMWDYVVSAAHILFGGATIPLMWLAVAGIVYGATNAGGWRGALHRTAGHGATALLDRAAPARQRIQRRWTRVPQKLRDKLLVFARSQLGRFEPIADSARVILHGGVLALSLYILGYVVLAWLDMSGSFYGLQNGSGYLFRGVAWLLGPHPIEFWKGFAESLGLVSAMIIEPLRVCLIVSTFAYCVEHVAKLQLEAKQNLPVTAGEIDGGGDGVVGQQKAQLQPTGVATLLGGAVGGRNELADTLRSPAPHAVSDESDAVSGGGRSRPVDRDHE